MVACWRNALFLHACTSFGSDDYSKDRTKLLSGNGGNYCRYAGMYLLNIAHLLCAAVENTAVIFINDVNCSDSEWHGIC